MIGQIKMMAVNRRLVRVDFAAIKNKTERKGRRRRVTFIDERFHAPLNETAVTLHLHCGWGSTGVHGGPRGSTAASETRVPSFFFCAQQ